MLWLESVVTVRTAFISPDRVFGERELGHCGVSEGGCSTVAPSTVQSSECNRTTGLSLDHILAITNIKVRNTKPPPMPSKIGAVEVSISGLRNRFGLKFGRPSPSDVLNLPMPKGNVLFILSIPPVGVRSHSSAGSIVLRLAGAEYWLYMLFE